MTIDPEIEAAIMWSCSEYPGLERLVVRRAKSGGRHQLAGHALIALAGEQFDIGFQIEVEADWRTQSERMKIDGSRLMSIAVSVGGGRHWQIAGAETEPDIYLQDIL